MRRLGHLGLEPVSSTAIIGAATTVVGSALNIGTKLWGSNALEEAQKEALKKAQLQAKRDRESLAREAARNAEEIARAEALAEQQALVAEANTRRSITITALYAVGGVAVLASGFFLWAAIRRRRRG